MSAALQQPPVGELPPSPSGSLLKAELHRFRARRFVQVLVGLAALGWLAVTLISLTQFGTPTPAELAAAEAQVAQFVEENERFREECLADPNRPDGVPEDEFCGPPVTEADFDLGMFLDTPPFAMAEGAGSGAIGFAAAGAALAFVLGATWIGAEWTSRSLVSLLFWETRRFRVVVSKLAVLVLGAAVLGVALQAAWLATAGILDATAGDGDALPDGFWPDLLATQARGVLLVVLAAVGGFGLTFLVRNTGAALGIGFVYFAIVETAVGAFRPRWQPWLLTNNAAGLLLPGGNTVFSFEDTVDASGNVISEPWQYVITNLQGGVLLGAVAVVAVAIGVVVFARSDIH